MMLFSARWYRVAALRPQLRAQVELERQTQRGVPRFLLVDRAGEQIHQLNSAAYQFVGRCDGTLSVQQIWDGLLSAGPDAAMTQDEAVDLLIALHDRGLMQFDVAPDVESIFLARGHQRRRKRAQGVNPLAFRIPLGDPSRWLARAAAITPWLFSVGGFLRWFVLVLGGGLVAAMHGSELASHAAKILASPGYIFLAWLIYPAIKLIHEAAHALAVQHYGGQVRQVGVSLLMLTPVPFINASAADRFRYRHQRAVVSAAGIMVELAIAVAALAVWLAVQPGSVRDAAFVVMFIGGLSAVVTNGNPLMRFDGYYLFCDLLDLRNLASRSIRWWAEGCSRHLLGVPPQPPLETLPGERFWLIAYAPLSWLYRTALAIVLVLWVGGWSSLLGLLVGGWMLVAIFGRPLARVARHLQHTLLRDAERRRALYRGAAVVLGAVLVVAVVPLPYGTLAEGVVWLPEKAQIRVGTDGFITALAAHDGQRVKAGDVLASLQDDTLTAERASHVGAAAELEVQLYAAMQNEPDAVPAMREKLSYARAEAARLDERMAHLEVRAQADGVVVLPNQADLPGSFHKRGELLGHLLSDSPLLVRVAVPQQQAELVRNHLNGILVRLAEDRLDEHKGRILLDMPGTVEHLPSAALGDRYGGRIATDGDDKDGLIARSPVVLMDIELPSVRGSRVGGRALLRFDHGWQPIGAQLLRTLRQLVLARFSPAS